MESQYVLRCFYHNVAILLIFSVVGIEVGKFESKSDLDHSNADAFCNSSKKYLMTSYFGKYENLLDSNFEEFITQELHTSLCEVPEHTSFVIRQSVLQRDVIGKGSHRHLSSSIRLYIDPESSSRIPFDQCELIAIERLPSEVFADPFELQHLHQRGVFEDIAVFGDTNLELPSFASNKSAVEIHMNISPNSSFSQKDGLEIQFQLPLHARYQPLDETGYRQIEFGDPDLFLRCCHKLEGQSCLFASTSENAEPRTQRATWRMPSGVKAHAEFVSTITFVSAFLSTISIVFTSIFCSGSKPCKTSKLS